jgi:hypothetical protein
MPDPKWKGVEKLVHGLHTQLFPKVRRLHRRTNTIACESNVEHRLDITIRHAVARYKILIIIERKDECRPIGVGNRGQTKRFLMFSSAARFPIKRNCLSRIKNSNRSNSSGFPLLSNDDPGGFGNTISELMTGL